MKAPADAEFVFFYGTLLPEIAAPEVRRIVEKLERVDSASVAGRLYDLGPYPALASSGAADPSSEARPPDARVRGAVFRLPADPHILRLLDRYEGHDAERPDRSLFVRTKKRAALDRGGEVTAWCYRYNGDLGGAPPIASGDYLAYRRMKDEEGLGLTGREGNPRLHPA